MYNASRDNDAHWGFNYVVGLLKREWFKLFQFLAWLEEIRLIGLVYDLDN